MPITRRLLTLLLSLLLVLYPLLVYFGLQQLGPKVLALLLMLLALGRLLLARVSRQPLGNGLWLLLAAALAGGLTLMTGSLLGLKCYPVVINGLMLAMFGASLWQPPSMIERFARLQTPDLPEHAIAYTRKVTWVWCGFFVVNGTLAALTTQASDQLWALYNGLISYLLMGLLLAGEYPVRLYVQRQHRLPAQPTTGDSQPSHHD